MQVLGMLDPPAGIRPVGVRSERPLEDVQGLAVAPVTDRVDTELEPMLEGETGGLLDAFDRARVEASRLWRR